MEGKVPKGKTCSGPTCPFCNPLFLAMFLVGSMVIFYARWPYQMLGWLTMVLAYLLPLLRINLE